MIISFNKSMYNLLLGTLVVFGCQDNSTVKDKFLGGDGVRIIMKENGRYILPSDSIDIIASNFIWFDSSPRINNFVIEEPGIDQWFINNRTNDLAVRYFPKIMKRYPLDFYDSTLMICYLAKIGDDTMLRNLKSKRSRLSKEENHWLDFHLKNFKL